MKKEYFNVLPVFSVDGLPDELLSKKVKDLRIPINTALAVGKRIINGASIVVAPLPGALSLLGGNKSMSMDSAVEYLISQSITPAPAQFLLGLLRYQNDFLVPRFKDALRIEIFSVYPEQFFSDQADQKGRSLQLCLRRKEDKIILDVSDYIRDEEVNYDKRFSAQAIRGLFYAPPIEDSEVASDDTHKLKGKIIG